MNNIIHQDVIQKKIFIIRGQKVMLSPHLAELYSVEVRSLIQSVKRNIDRFPEDFMFQLNITEIKNLKSQIVISSWGGSRFKPYAFTEQGVAMLSSVLNSPRAIKVNIQLIRTFVQLRHMFTEHKELAHRLEELERKVGKLDGNIQNIFEAIRQLMTPPPQPPKRPIGFHVRD